MFTTAARSLITPHNAANAMGVARPRVLLNMPTRLKDLPAVAQSRNAATKENATTLIIQPVDRMPRASSHAPRKTVITINTYRDACTGNTRSGMLKACAEPIKFMPKVAV